MFYNRKSRDTLDIRVFSVGEPQYVKEDTSLAQTSHFYGLVEPFWFLFRGLFLDSVLTLFCVWVQIRGLARAGCDGA